MKNIIGYLLAIYMFFVFKLTLIDRITTANRRRMLLPFWEYRELLINTNHLYWCQQIGCNILMLVPLGLLLPLLSKRFRKCYIIIFIGLLLSSFIEITQYFTCRGLCEFDDVFNNTFGAFIGYLLFKLIFTIRNNRHVSWPIFRYLK